MRARYKSPNGTGTIDLTDDATLQEVLNELKDRTGLQSFTIKYGPPMAMRSLDLSRLTETAKDLRLHGETLTIVPDEPRSITPIGDTVVNPPNNAESQNRRRSPQDGPEDINVPWPERDGTLCERPRSPKKHNTDY